MTYQNAIVLFHKTYPELHKGSGIDYWTAQEAWSMFTDSLCKNGDITQRQWNNWETPFKYGQKL